MERVIKMRKTAALICVSLILASCLGYAAYFYFNLHQKKLTCEECCKYGVERIVDDGEKTAGRISFPKTKKVIENIWGYYPNKSSIVDRTFESQKQCVNYCINHQ